MEPLSYAKYPSALKTIGEVSEDIGVATHVLRFWESKFQQITPQKRRGRRYYSANDINIIKTIKELLYDNGYTIKGVHKFLQDSKKLESLNALPSNANKFKKDFSGKIIAGNENAKNSPLGIAAEKLVKLQQIYAGLSLLRNKIASI